MEWHTTLTQGGPIHPTLIGILSRPTRRAAPCRAAIGAVGSSYLIGYTVLTVVHYL